MSQAATPGPTTRRSTRLSSAPRSVVSQSAVSVNIPARDTPSRRKAALPKVKARQSTAYGASARIGAAQELEVPQTGFAETFDAHRGAAIASRSDAPLESESRQDDESEDPESDEDFGEPEANEDEEEEEESGNTSKSFGMGHEGGMMRAATATPGRQTPLATQTPLMSRTTQRVVTSTTVTNGGRQPLSSANSEEGADIRSRYASQKEKEYYNALLYERDDENAPRIPLIRKKDDLTDDRPAFGGATPRATFGRPRPMPTPVRQTPRQPIRSPLQAGLAEARNPSPLKPMHLQNGTPRQSSLRSEVHFDSAAKGRSASIGRDWPWYYYALAGLGAILALVGAAAIPLALSSSRTGGAAGGWRGFVSRLTRSPASVEDVSSMKSRVNDVELSLKNIQQHIHSLGDEIPEYVVVSRSPSGTINVAKEFWDGIISRIRTEGPSIEWDTFVQKNQAELDKALDKESVIIREDLLALFKKNFHDIDADLNRKLELHTKELTAKSLKIASVEAKKVTREYQHFRGQALSNLISNIELHHNKINYAAPGLGASIITGITSPTYAPDLSTTKRVLQRLLSMRHNSPTFALTKWDEPGECWCAAPDEDGTGKAQLGIQLAEPISPTQLTIEHLPRAAAPGKDIQSAPQYIELWVEDSDPAIERFTVPGAQCEPGPEGWECLGKVRYDISGSNHVQTFVLDGKVQSPVDKVMVRVTSNHGADHTCLYRVRISGTGLRQVDDAGDAQ